MIKKKVLVQGSLESLIKFFSSKFSVEFEALALVTDELKKLPPSVNLTGTGKRLEIFTTDTFPRFALNLIDGIVLTDKKSQFKMINRLCKIGIEPQKIILWNKDGVINFFDTKAPDGTNYIFMEGLKFHIRNQDDLNFFNEMRYVLQNQRQFYAIDPSYYPEMFAQTYQQVMGKPLDWNNLQTWTEKMQWIKLYDSTPIKTRLADKYLVRQWVAEKIGQEYLIPLLGVWDNFDDIDFENLPNQFVLKCNHGSGMNIICRDKNKFDFENAKQKLTGWLAVDFGARFWELHYCNIKRKIIAEKFMTDGKNLYPIDYKFMCFDGKVFCCQCETERSSELRLDFFDMDWKHLDFERADHICNDHPEKIIKPKNFELMKNLAEELCKEFTFVRVDFYEIGDKIYFGEMTFVPGTGIFRFKSEGTDELWGSLMTLPN